MKTNEAEAWWLGHEGEHAGDNRHAENVPPDRDVGEEGHHPHSEGVEHAVHDQDAGVDDEYVAGRRRIVRRHVQERGEEERKAVVDTGGDRRPGPAG